MYKSFFICVHLEKPKGYEDFIESHHRLCTSNDCLSFNPNDLCTHLHSDHNYYGVCINLLDPHMESSIMPGGKRNASSLTTPSTYPADHNNKKYLYLLILVFNKSLILANELFM